MDFITLKDIREGMVLARDFRILSLKENENIMLKAGMPLNKNHLVRLKNLGCSGLFIHGKDYNPQTNPIAYSNSIISKELKKEAITTIEKLFESVEKNPIQVDSAVVETVNNLSFRIVDSIVDNSKYLVSVIDLKMFDDYTYHHSLSVAILSISIGLALDLDKKTLYDLGLSAMLHDIGKTEVPYGLISKDSALSKSEFEIIKAHPLKGAKYVMRNNYVTDKVYEGIVSHHEKYDGTGYPFQLKGEDIPLFGRIISVADVYDALTSNRPYRIPSTPSEAIEYIMGGNESMFDPIIVNAFLRKIAPFPVNDYVELSNGKIAIVTRVYSQNPLRPKVKVIDETNLEYDLFLDPSSYSITINGLV